MLTMRLSQKSCVGSKFWGHVVFFNFWFCLLGHLFSPQFQCICPGEFFSLFKKVIFGVVFWRMRLLQSQILRPLPQGKKPKSHVTVLSIVKVFFPVLIFKIYQFSKFWKILALNEKKTNFGILKNKLHSKQFWDIYAFWNFEGFNFFIIFGEVLSCPKFAFLKSDKKILLDIYFGILSWKNAPKIQKQKLKNITGPQNFDSAHSLWENRGWTL